MKRTFFACSIAALTLTCGGVRASVVFDDKPPGTIVQDVTAYLSGEAMSSGWRVVTSRVMVGRQNGKDPAYQWYVSVYHFQPTGVFAKLVYRSPGAQNDNVLSRVEKAKGAQLYFPIQTVNVAGAGEFRRQGVQDVVIVAHEAGADCGSSTVSVMGYNAAARRIEPRVQITNGCELQAAIVKSGSMRAIRLTGPYYSKTAPLCCPTKPRAVAMLAYRNGAWSVRPNYFMISASIAAHK